MFQQLQAAKDDGLPVTEVIELITESLTRDDSWRYRPYLDYYKASIKVSPKLLPPGCVPRPWQQAVIAFLAMPVTDDTNNRGLWIHLPAGEGKTWCAEYVHDYYPKPAGHFQPGIRPNGQYDFVSFRSYIGQPIIIMDDLACSTKELDNGTVVQLWKRNLLNVLKGVCNKLPTALEFAGEYIELYFKARIIVTSNFPLPTGSTPEEAAALQRRFISIDSADLARSTIKARVPAAFPASPGTIPCEPEDPDDLPPDGVPAPGEPLPPVPPPAPRNSPGLAPPPAQRRRITIEPLRIGPGGNSVPLAGAPPSSPPGLLTAALRVRQPTHTLIPGPPGLPGCAPGFFLQSLADNIARNEREDVENRHPDTLADLMHFEL